MRSAELLLNAAGVRAGLTAALIWLMNVGALPAQQTDHSDYTVGIPWAGETGVRERTADIMEREWRGRTSPRSKRIHPRPRQDFQNVPGIRESPATSTLPALDMGGELSALGSPQTLGVNFTGATFADTHTFPPDSMGAAGPAQFIVHCNGRIRTFDKTTGIADGVIDADTDVFFQSVMTPPVTNNFTTDPRIRYDRLSRRWIATMIDVPNQTSTSPNRIMIAVSDGPIITTNTVWNFFQFQHDQVSPAGDAGKFADYPTLGIDANALYIGVNVFGTTGQGTFDNSTAFVVRKSSILGAGPIVVTAFRGLVPSGNNGGPFTPQGVDNYDPNATEGYLIGVNSRDLGRLALRRVSSPGGTPSISGNVDIIIPVNGGTITVPHLGNTGGAAGNLDGLDYRLLGAHIRNGRLWTTANIAVDNAGLPSGTDTRMGVRWYELGGIATGQTPGVVQSGTVFESSPSNTTTNRNYWMGAVVVSGQGHASMGFSVAGANEYINAGTVGRLAGDPLGTMRTPALYTASASAYNPPGDSGGAEGRRWGDYSYTSLDPNDDMTMWTIQEFCNAPDTYGVQVVRLLAPLPATPTNCNPSSIPQGTTNLNIVVTGVSVDGSGFFDPGAGFSNRIAAAVNGGGVAINSVNYSNPTNLTLNVTVLPFAVPGARTITVTNPDGQTATSAGGILTITAVFVTNHPPVLTLISNQIVAEQTLLTFGAIAIDPDAGQSLTFSLDPGAPTNATINPTNGVFAWTPTENQAPSTNPITVRVTDNGSPNLSDTNTFIVVAGEVNLAPTLTAISNLSVNEGSLVTFTNTASDPDLPANTLSFSPGPNTPAGAAVNPVSGVFTWIPAEDQGPGIFTVKIVVSDNGSPSRSATNEFTVTVSEVNRPPVVAAISDRTVYVGTALMITNIASDPDIPTNTLTFSLSPSAPAGASINPTNGVFTWTPTDAQAPSTNSIVVRVNDDGSPTLSDMGTFSITVLARPLIQSITLSGANVTLVWSAIVGTTYQVQYRTDLVNAVWTALPPNVTATADTASKMDSIGPALQRFYRVVVMP